MDESVIYGISTILSIILGIALWRLLNESEGHIDREKGRLASLEAEHARIKYREEVREHERIIKEDYSDLKTRPEILAYIEFNSRNLPLEDEW